MSEIRLYVDEDAEQDALVNGLRNRGVDVITAIDAQLIGRSDTDQLDYAIDQDRTLYSLNVSDFSRLHKEYLDAGRDHSGIVLISKQRYRVGEKIRRLVDLVNSKSAEELQNQIEYL